MTPPQPPSQTLRHSTECRCDTCVVDKADKRLAAGIVAQLALTGCIEDSERAEQRALTEICRALLRAEAALAAQEASPQDEVEYWVRRYNELEQWRIQQSVMIVELQKRLKDIAEASPQPDLTRAWFEKGWKWRDDHHAYSADQGYAAYLAACRQEQP